MRGGARALGLALGLALASTSLARAAGSDEDEARAAMRRGAAALEQGDAEAALSEYQLAKRLAPSANAPWFFAADALERLGRWRQAVESFEGYIAKDPTVSDAARVKERIAKLRAEHFPARVRILADGPPGTPTAAATVEVSVDGGPTWRPAPGPLELEPGKHHLEVRAPSFERASQDVDVVGDTESTVSFALRPTPAPGAVTPTTAPAPAASGVVPWRTVGWVGAAAGAVGFVTMFILDAAVLGPKIDDYRQAVGRKDSAGAFKTFSEADSLRRGLLVGYATSSAVLVGGVLLGLLGPGTRRVGLVPRLGPRTAGLAMERVF